MILLQLTIISKFRDYVNRYLKTFSIFLLIPLLFTLNVSKIPIYIVHNLHTFR